MSKQKASYFGKCASYDDCIQALKDYCCEKFFEEAEKLIAYVKSDKPIPDECYFTLQSYLTHLLDFNRTDDTDE